MISQAALLGIHGYQRWLSPRKGYRCAYSVRHGGTGCSGYAKHAIRDHGLIAALPLIRARFADCRTAAEETEEERRQRKRERRSDTCSCCADAGTFAPTGCGTSTAARGGAGKFCDTNPCDGDIGCGACSVDVCSCSP